MNSKNIKGGFYDPRELNSVFFVIKELSRNFKENILSLSMPKDQYFIKCLGRNEIRSF